MYHIIVNSVSRKKRAQKNLKVFLAAAEERGRECAVHYTRCAGGGKELAEKITAENPAAEIVVVGETERCTKCSTGSPTPPPAA